MNGPKVCFDVLILGDANVTPSAATVEQLRPSAESIERCVRWLGGKGVTCHRTDFGLACEASAELFQQLFGVAARPVDNPSGPPAFELDGEPLPPPEIARFVNQITVAPPPTFY